MAKTVSSPTEYVPSGACMSKKLYVTESEAEKAVREVWLHRRLRVRFYLCPECKGYHLTKQVQNANPD